MYKKAIHALNLTVNESYLWPDSSIVLTQIHRPPNNWNAFVGNRAALIQEETAAGTWRHLPPQSLSAELILSGMVTKTLSTSTLCWKGPQWLTQEPSSGLISEVNTSTDNLEARKVHVASLQAPDDIPFRFSKLNRLIRVIVYCRRFINTCRNSKANRQSTTLPTQDLDLAPTCCVKMVQQISYAQEIKELGEKQEVAVNSSLKTTHPFLDKENLLRFGGRLKQSALPYQTRHLTILPANHFTKLCQQNTSECFMLVHNY